MTIAILLLPIIITGCSGINIDQQKNNDIAPEQQTEREEQSTQRIDTTNETEVSPLATFKIISALAGLENGVLVNETSKMEYSGTRALQFILKIYKIKISYQETRRKK